MDQRTEELKFPVECHFRIIAEDLNNMHFVIETVLITLGITDPLEKANTSAGGKYVSFGFSTIVQSREHMNLIDTELRNIRGVRMVL